MRIGIDARPLISEKPSGIGIYVLEILKNIPADDSDTYILYSNEPIRNDNILLKRFQLRIVKCKIGTLAVCFGLRKLLKEDQIDVFWGTEHMIPLNASGVKKVLTVHDLALLINPSWGSIKNALMQNIFCRLSCKASDSIIAISNATKSDLINKLKMPSNKIDVILNGGYVFNEFDSIDVEKIKIKFKLNSDLFFSYIGNIEPRKNIVRLIKGFEIFNDTRDDKHYLILAGKLSWKTKPIIKAIQDSKYRNYIILPGYVSEQEKFFLMSDSIAFLFPSNYEGFGIPILEAMSCGGIVITATNSSLMEVGGNAAVYVSSNDEKGIADAMIKCADMSFRERKNRIETGYAWISNFDWKKCAVKTLKVIKK